MHIKLPKLNIGVIKTRFYIETLRMFCEQDLTVYG